MQLKFTLVFLIIIGSSSANAGPLLKSGDTAPAFELTDQYQKSHKLSDYLGKWVVLYFYPKDDTPGCTTEACQFRDDIFNIHALNAEVLGVSLDSAESHTEFAKKYGIPFPLLSDAKTVTAEKYGCLSSFGPFKFAKRHTFIINPEGKLVKIYREVDPKKHSEEIIAELTRLQSQY